MVQLDYDEEMGPLHGMYGSMEAEYEEQRTIKRAELTAFLCLLRKVCLTHQGPCGQQGKNCMGYVKSVRHRGGSGRHVKAHRTKKEKEKMTQFERFVTEGNEKADEEQ